ncbi:DUF4097 domain-containing protein [Candidatus Poribacteria bacterium]|nr:DUF4097 domain-containing protein [Candidatus Poribacteria bacterium]
MKRILLFTTVLLLFLSSLTLTVSAQHKPSAVKDALNSIVAIEFDNIHGKTVSRGLGFFVSQNKVATHLSNLNDFNPLPKGLEVYVKLVGKRTRYQVDSITVPNKLDHLAFLNISIPGVKPLLSISNKTKHSETVYTISDPSKPELVKGTVKGNSKNGKYLRVSNPISRKNIGSPILNSKGEVIGISMLLSELSSEFVYNDGNIDLSVGKGNSVSIKTKSSGGKSIGGIKISDNIVKVGDSSFAVSSTILKKHLADSNGGSINPTHTKDITGQRKSDLNRIEKAFDINAGGRLTIDTDIGNIDVQSADHDIAQVIVTKESKNELDISQDALDDFKVTFNKEGSNLTIKGEFENGRNYWRRQQNDLKIRFQVTVPKKYNVDLNTPSGDLSIEGVTGKVQAQSSAGDITGKNIFGTVNTQTSAGDLRLEKVKGIIFGRSSDGDITLANCQGKVDVKTSEGDIHAETSTQPKHDWNLKSSDGDIVFTLISNLAAEIDAQTKAGSISTDFHVQGTEIQNKRLHGTVNGGGKLLKLRTSVGDIRLKSK